MVGNHHISAQQRSERSVTAAFPLQTDYMDSLAYEAAERGGECDQDTFLRAFYGIGRPVQPNDYQLPKNIDQVTRQLDDLEYCAYEPYVIGAAHSPESVRRVGIVLPSDADEAYGPAVTRYEIRYDGRDFTGRIYFAARTALATIYGTFEDRQDLTETIASATRIQGNPNTHVQTNMDTNSMAIGMPSIRKAIESNPSRVFHGTDQLVALGYSALRKSLNL